MVSSKTLLHNLTSNQYDGKLCEIYCCSSAKHVKQRISYVVNSFLTHFSYDQSDVPIALYSAPGRTEIGGNHTDHQHGCTLAASVNQDVLACAAPNATNTIQVLSEGYPLACIDLSSLKPQANERNTTEALIRGIASKISSLGYPVKGFDVYATSNVLKGSGLSSSAAFEVLIGTIINHLFCENLLSPIEIAQIGQFAENEYFGKPCGLMDQIASSVGGVIAMDFKNPHKPMLQKIHLDLEDYDYALCIIDTGGDHANLTDEYSSILLEMKSVANCFGKEVLQEVDELLFMSSISKIRSQVNDRALLRAIHFFNDTRNAKQEATALLEDNFSRFLSLVLQSGQSSFMYLQNVYHDQLPQEQPLSLALALAGQFLKDEGAYRVHGGGFAGTIQAFVPLCKVQSFKTFMESVFGNDTCHIMSIRPVGGITLID